MTFSVQPAAFYAFQVQLSDLAKQAGDGKGYARENVALSEVDRGYAGGLFWAEAIKAVQDVSAAVTQNLDRVKELVEASALEVVRTATMYSRTDQASAERLDNTYPEQP
ncbi:MAG TPA: hypothetical protein VF821_22610 [Lentzea sp.]